MENNKRLNEKTGQQMLQLEKRIWAALAKRQEEGRLFRTNNLSLEELGISRTPRPAERKAVLLREYAFKGGNQWGYFSSFELLGLDRSKQGEKAKLTVELSGEAAAFLPQMKQLCA